MSATKKEKVTEVVEVLGQSKEKKKTCFVIMPIAEHPDYEKGHFKRVYDYLIKPACEAAGYEAIRADDSKASHMIMFDILKKIVECDMAICDLTTKNANVFYELGLRQAFNKKTILITDGKEKAPFDIAGFRYVEYSSSLRVDETTGDIKKITSMLKETESAPESDVNSIVKLLEIEPAKIDYKSLNSEESMFFKMLMEMDDKLEKISRDVYTQNPNIIYPTNRGLIKQHIFKNISHDKRTAKSLSELMNEKPRDYMNYEYRFDDKIIGKIINIGARYITFDDGQEKLDYPNIPDARNRIYALID
ncbi:hypothetical protein L7842_013530 [Providencia rettgeri]|uniref:hypothetical protein n=1 Tax=Providencia rettgeri TaxID=587 RepID=UPI001EE72F54|nr:hypothetical protein [Providencia rettgeri]MCG5292497.1 hypothetical protein [Providencia rettgeri]